MSTEQIIVTIAVAIIGLLGGVTVERLKQKREREKALDGSALELKRAELVDEGLRRKEIDDAARELRNFLKAQVSDLNQSLASIEKLRAEERDKWNDMLGQLSTKNLELELAHKRDGARIAEMEEDATFLDEQIKTQRVRISSLEVEATVLIGKLQICEGECARLRSRG